MNITLNIDLPESLTEAELCSSLERVLRENWCWHVLVNSVKKSSDAEELVEFTTPSPAVSMGVCNCEGSDNPANWGHTDGCCFWDDVRPVDTKSCVYKDINDCLYFNRNCDWHGHWKD